MLDQADGECENGRVQFFIVDILQTYDVSELYKTLTLLWQELSAAVWQFKRPPAKQNQLHPDVCIILRLYIILSKRLSMRLVFLMTPQPKPDLIPSPSIQIFNTLQTLLDHPMYTILDQLQFCLQSNIFISVPDKKLHIVPQISPHIKHGNRGVTLRHSNVPISHVGIGTREGDCKVNPFAYSPNFFRVFRGISECLLCKCA